MLNLQNRKKFCAYKIRTITTDYDANVSKT